MCEYYNFVLYKSSIGEALATAKFVVNFDNIFRYMYPTLHLLPAYNIIHNFVDLNNYVLVHMYCSLMPCGKIPNSVHTWTYS